MEAMQLDLLFEFDTQECSEGVIWSDEDIKFLMEWMLIRSLEVLAASTRLDSEQEILDWINCSDIDNPFSFNRCCAVAGYHSDDLRDSVNQMYKRP